LHESRKWNFTTREAYAMRPIAVIGIIFIVIGIIALAYQGLTYTTKEKVVDLGPLKVEAKREKTIPLPPVLGVLALGAGVVMVVAGARGR
jgi:hypothetical protein